MEDIIILQNALGDIYNINYDYDEDYTISDLKRKIDDMRDIAIKAIKEIT